MVTLPPPPIPSLNGPPHAWGIIEFRNMIRNLDSSNVLLFMPLFTKKRQIYTFSSALAKKVDFSTLNSHKDRSLGFQIKSSQLPLSEMIWRIIEFRYPISDIIGNFDYTNVFLTGPIEGIIHDKCDRRKLLQLMLRQRFDQHNLSEQVYPSYQTIAATCRPEKQVITHQNM